MQLQAYKGYFEQGRFYTEGTAIPIPERRQITLIIDEPTTVNENGEAWQEFLQAIKKIDNEPLTEFERVKFREVEI